MTELKELNNILLKSSETLVDKKISNINYDKTFPSVIYGKNDDGTYQIVKEGNIYNVKCALGYDLKVTQSVWVTMPSGQKNLKDMYISGIRGENKSPITTGGSGSGSTEVTKQGIIDALGYTPSSKSDISELQVKIDNVVDGETVVGEATKSTFDSLGNNISETYAKTSDINSSVSNLQSQIDDKVPITRTINGKALSTDLFLTASDVGADVSGSAQNVQDALDTHKNNSDIHFTPDERTKLNGIETNANNYVHPTSGVSEGTYKSVTVDKNGHVTSASNPTTLSEYGITDAETKGTADSVVSFHNTSTESHNDIRLLITELTNKLNALADSDDETLDQMSEIVEYIKANKGLIDSIITSKIDVSDIVDNLTTNVLDKPLSAAQGVVIKSLIDALETEINNLSIGEIVCDDTLSDSSTKPVQNKVVNEAINNIINGTTPAGDSKKLDGLTKKEFVKGASPFFASGETILDWANNPNGVYNKMALTEIVIPSDGVANISGFYTLKIDDGARKTVTFHGWYSNVTKQRHVWAGAWVGDWEGLDADTVGGFHALDFMLTQWKDLRTNKQFEDIFSTTLTNTHECWNKWCFVEATDLDNAPNMGIQWYEVFTGGIETRAFQFAISCFAHDRACYFRTKHDSVWSGWFNFAITEDLANYLPLDGSVPMTGDKLTIRSAVFNVEDSRLTIAKYVDEDRTLRRDMYITANNDFAEAFKVGTNESGSWVYKTLLHTGNMASHVLPLDGSGVMRNFLWSKMDGDGYASFTGSIGSAFMEAWTEDKTQRRQLILNNPTLRTDDGDSLHIYNTATQNYNTVLHTGNINTYALTSTSPSGYSTDIYGNFIHKSTGASSDYFHLFNSAQTSSLKYYWETGELSTPYKVTGGDKAELWSDSEGGNLRLTSPNGKRWSIDTLGDGIRFIYEESSVPITFISNGTINATTFNGTATVANTSHNTNWVNQNTSLTYGVNGMQYFNASMTAGSTAGVNDSPTSDWYHIIRMNHGNANGYYVDLGVCFHSNILAYKRVANGTSHGWITVLDSSNYSSYCAPSSHTQSASTITTGTFPAAVGFANGVWNPVGDDAFIGDSNIAGCVCIKGNNGATGIQFMPYSGSTAQKISINGYGMMSITGSLDVSASTDYTTNKVRNTVFTASDPGANVATNYANGSIICVYE